MKLVCVWAGSNQAGWGACGVEHILMYFRYYFPVFLSVTMFKSQPFRDKNP